LLDFCIGDTLKIAKQLATEHIKLAELV
jgi:hypothetical protein